MNQHGKTILTLKKRKTSNQKGWRNKKQKLSFVCSLIMAALMIMSFAAFTKAPVFVEGVVLNGKVICQISDQEEANKIIAELLDQKSKSLGLPNCLSTDLHVAQVVAASHTFLSGESLRQALSQDCYFDLINAIALKLDDQTVLYMRNQQEVDAVLHDLTACYQEDGWETCFEQQVETITAKASLNQISDYYQAGQILTRGKIISKNYMVKAGDTYSSLADFCGVSLEELVALNPELNLEKTEVGQNITLDCPGALLNVLSVKTQEETQPIEFAIEEVQDNTLNYGQEKIVQGGINGKKRVLSKIIKCNGVMDRTEVVQETVTVEPQNQIIAIGTLNKNEHLIRPCSGVVTSNFGYRWGRLHAGTDFGGRTGDPIYAAASGVVIKVGNFGDGYGKQIMVDHGDGLVTRYAHLSAYSVSLGQEVSGGAVIGQLGSTGNSTGPHLHFETIVNGKAQNPLNRLN